MAKKKPQFFSHGKRVRSIKFNHYLRLIDCEISFEISFSESCGAKQSDKSTIILFLFLFFVFFFFFFSFGRFHPVLDPSPEVGPGA